ncbi:MAG: helix-turn-helix domain-containing protein [Nakamurella sp.]
MPTDRATVERSAKAAKSAAYIVHNILHNHPDHELVPLRDPDDQELTVPREAAELLRRILAAMAAGTPVQVIPVHDELTTQQAADILGVSRPHLIKLLDDGQIGYRLVGTHRRVLAESLRRYETEARAKQRRAMDELAKLTEDLDLY